MFADYSHASVMENFNWMNNFKPFFFWLKVAGLWPNDGSYGFDVYTIYSLISVSLFMVINTLCQTMEMFMVKFDLKVLAAALMVTTHIMMVIKVCIFVKKFAIIKNLISAFNYGDFQPRNEMQMKIAKTDLNLWMVLYRSFQIGVAVAAFAWTLRPIVDGSYKKHILPMFAWYPINSTTNLNYKLLYCYQTVSFFYAGTAQVNLDSLSVAFTVFLGIQCDLLSDNLRRMKNRSDLVRCIQHHNQILIFFNNFNDFFGNIILLQMFASASTMALILFQLSTTVPGTSDFYGLILISAVVPLEMFLYCWYGNEVALKSSVIPRAVFESQWVGTPVEFQKLLLIFAMRLKRPMIITAFNLFPLSLQTFMTILRSSWSYFTLLHQLNSQ